MKRLLFSACTAVIMLAACQSSEKSWQKTLSGIRYRVFHTTDSGRKVTMMATAKVNVTNLNDTTKKVPVISPMPVYQMVLPPAPYMTDPLAEVLTQAGVREGDSVVTVTEDNKTTAFAIRRIYIPGMDGLNIDSIVAIDKKRETDRFINAHATLAAPRIEAYLKSRNISAVKNADNTFTEIINAGTKPLADSGKIAGIKFSITNIVTNKVINSNKDTAFHQPPVLEYRVGQGGAPRPVDHVMRQLGKGGHARVYLPGIMAGPKTDPAQDVVFEVEVVSVK